MTDFQLFDSVVLREAVPLADGTTAPAGTPGAIVDVLSGGEAFAVELFGGWVAPDAAATFQPAAANATGAFVQTLGVEVVGPLQIRRVRPAAEAVGARTHLLALTEALPDHMVEEVAHFAEFLQQRETRTAP